MSSKWKLSALKKSKTFSFYDNFVPQIKPKSIELYPSPFLLRVSPLEEMQSIQEEDFSLSNVRKENEANSCEHHHKAKRARQSIINTLISKRKNSP